MRWKPILKHGKNEKKKKTFTIFLKKEKKFQIRMHDVGLKAQCQEQNLCLVGKH